MNQRILGVILAIQIVIIGTAVVLNFQSSDDPESFIQFELAELTSIKISSPEETILLTRTESAWFLSDGKPADSNKIDRVFSKLADAKLGWPVATSVSTAERFEVTEDKYQKHVELVAGSETVLDLYFGTSPGFRKAHIRSADGGGVYAIEFSNYELGTTASTWLDKEILKANGAISKIERVGEFSLIKMDEAWTSEPVFELDESKVSSYTNRFRELSVYDINDSVMPEQPQAVFNIEDSGGTHELALYHNTEDDEWIVTSNRITGEYNVASYIGKELSGGLSSLGIDQSDEEDADTTSATGGEDSSDQ